MLFELYGPQALQFSHAILYARGTWTIPLPEPAREQAVKLRAAASRVVDDELLSL